MFIFSGIFWSGVLILLGICIILNIIFKTHIPFVRIFFALLLVYIGVSLLFGRSWHRHRWHTMREPERITITGPSEKHDIIFGEGEIDLTGVRLGDRTIRAEVDVVFGSGVIRLNPAIPVRVDVGSAFAEARRPDGADMGFGDHVYRSPNLDESKPHLLVKADVVFGKLEITNVPGAVPPADTTLPRKGEL
jgi:hypothetical protein